MKFLISLIAVTSCLLAAVEAQPASDARSNYYNYFHEMLNPSWRQHRARLRPFASQLGSPVNQVRAGRSVTEEPQANCIVTDETITCLKTVNDKEVTVQCDVQEDFKNTALENVERYALSELRIMETDGEDIVKMYMYGQMDMHNRDEHYDCKQRDTEKQTRSIFSLHSKADRLEDRGLTVVKKECWNKMVTFFKEMSTVVKATVNKETLNGQTFKMESDVIATLAIF